MKIIEKSEFFKFHFYVVLGKAKQNVDKLLEYNKYNHIDVLYDISNMPDIMMQCDIAITSRGRTGFELAVLGIPSISIAQNEREARHNFMSAQNGFSYLGLQPELSMIEKEINKYINFTADERKQLRIKCL